MGKQARGRPTDYTEEKAAIICERLVNGESLRAICRDPDMPGMTTVFQWLAAHESFAKQYAYAREQQADAKFDELEELAATATPETANVVRLQVDTRKWVLARMSRKYSDKVIQEVSGPNGSPVKHQVAMTPDEAYKAMLDGK